MDRQYDSIPRQGKHLGSNVSEEPTTSVRSQEAVKPRPESESGGVVVCSYNESEGRYRVRRWPNAGNVTSEQGYEEIRRLPEGASADELREGAPMRGQFVVLENAQSGEVYFDRKNKLSDNWMDNGRYDQITLFDDEESAAAYADSRTN